MQFWLGLAHVNWLKQTDVPSMVSARALHGRRTFPRALGPVFQDSGGFTELSRGNYATLARDYAESTRRVIAELGNVAHVAVQDWMCEPIVRKATGLSVVEHQARTIESYLDLSELAPEVPWVPVLQGWEPAEYFHHIEQYLRRGIDLTRFPLVGVGTICRRQNATAAARLVIELGALGMRLHAFGFKITGVLRSARWLASTDSMAWSIDGRFPQGGRCSPVRGHVKCSNCLDYALLWRQRLLERIEQMKQQPLLAGVA